MSNKVYLTRNIDVSNKNLNVSEKFEIVKRFLSVPEDQRLSKRKYAMSHGIAEQTFKDWLTHYLRSDGTDIITMQERGGTKCLFDDISIEAILKHVDDNQTVQKSNTRKRLAEFMNQELDETKRRRGFFVGPTEVSPRYVNDFIKKYDIRQKLV